MIDKCLLCHYFCINTFCVRKVCVIKEKQVCIKFNDYEKNIVKSGSSSRNTHILQQGGLHIHKQHNN